jgi:endonuclease G
MAARRRGQLRESEPCRCGRGRGGKRKQQADPKSSHRRLSKKVDELAQVIAAFTADTPLPRSLRTGPKKGKHRAKTVGQAVLRIVGGMPVQAGEFPECALIGRRRANGTIKWFCTGVLVHQKLVLTAAHCFQPRKPANVVALNTDDMFDLRNAELRNVRRMVIHPQYANSGRHDIAVMVLRRASNVTPVRLAETAELSAADETTLVGFGNDDILSTRGFGVKREVTVPITHGPNSSEEDEEELGFESNLEFVAGGEGFDSCNGDSGGPAYIKVGSERVVAGLTSRATETARNPCGEGGIYTRVDQHVQFIDDVASDFNINF